MSNAVWRASTRTNSPSLLGIVEFVEYLVFLQSQSKATRKMLVSASSEFITLARSQMALLAQSLGATLSIVYLTQNFVDNHAGEDKLLPVVVYPDTGAIASSRDTDGVELADLGLTRNLLGTPIRESSQGFFRGLHLPGDEIDLAPSINLTDEYVVRGDRMALPLIHEDVIVGVLVTIREDRIWHRQERVKIEKIAQTLAIACILDRQRTWFQRQLHEQQLFQEKQIDLLDNLLHQFRNPLTALRTFGKLLLKRLKSGDTNRDAAASIVRESDRLQELLQKFDEAIDLDIEDLKPILAPANQMIVETSPSNYPKPALLLPGAGEKQVNCSFLEILLPLLDSVQAIALERHLQVVTEIPVSLPPITANPKALREVLSNILDNALKYTPTGGKILVQAGLETETRQGVAVSDTGPGISMEDLSHLGERGYRGIQAQTDIPGTGLGYAIAKQLIEQMQGEIQVFSPALDSVIKSDSHPGTTFILWLPVAEGVGSRGSK